MCLVVFFFELATIGMRRCIYSICAARARLSPKIMQRNIPKGIWHHLGLKDSHS